MLNDIGENVMIKTKVVKRRKHSMNLYEKNIKDLVKNFISNLRLSA